MGFTFRDHHYSRFVRVGKRTIKDGEAASIWTRTGKQKIVIGPSLQRLFYAHVRFLQRHTAEPTQYLEVHHKDGSISHIRGPHTMFQDPVSHESVRICDMLHVASAQECVAVYTDESMMMGANNNSSSDGSGGIQQNGVVSGYGGGGGVTPGPSSVAVVAAAHKTNSKKGSVATTAANADIGPAVPEGTGHVHRWIVKGPTRLMPAVHEWLHTFKWSWTDAQGSSSKTSFQKLTLSQQVWNVHATLALADNEHATVMLTVEFHVQDIERVLLSTDPLASMRSALQADMAVLGPQLEGHRLMSNSAYSASVQGRQAYPHMVAAGELAGLSVDSIVFRGFKPSTHLEEKLLATASAVTKRRQEQDAAEQRAALVRVEIAQREERASAEQRIAQAEFESAQTKADHERTLAQQAQAHELKLQLKGAECERQLAAGPREDAVAMLKTLSELGVDLTKYLCGAGPGVSQQPAGGKTKSTTAGANRFPTMHDVRVAVAQALQLEATAGLTAMDGSV